MSDGMTDKRSQPDDVIELRRRVIEDAAAHSAEAAKNATDLLKQFANHAAAEGLTPSEWIRRQLAKARQMQECSGSTNDAQTMAQEIQRKQATLGGIKDHTPGQPDEVPAKRRSIDPEAAAEVRRSLARRDEFEIRHAALDLAVRTGVGAGYALEVATQFLPFLQGDMTGLVKQAPKVDAAPERSPDEITAPAWLYAEVGDIVLVEGCKIPDLHGEYLVTRTDDVNRFDARIAVRAHGRDSIWVPNWAVKRIVRKAAAGQ